MISKTSWRVILLLTWILEKTSPETMHKAAFILESKGVLFFHPFVACFIKTLFHKWCHSKSISRSRHRILLSILSWVMVWRLNGKRCSSSLALKNVIIQVWIQLNLLSLNWFTYYSRIIHANCSKHYYYKTYSLNCNILLHWSYIQNIITYVLHFDFKYHSK